MNTTPTGPDHEPSRPAATAGHTDPGATLPRGERGPRDSDTLPTVLYIEDDPGNAALARAILATRDDMRLVVAPDGTTGLELAREHRPCLVLLDLHLPDMTGQQLLTELRHDPCTKHIPIVIMSADPTPGQIPHADGILSKPYQISQLTELVNHAVTTKL